MDRAASQPSRILCPNGKMTKKLTFSQNKNKITSYLKITPKMVFTKNFFNINILKNKAYFLSKIVNAYFSWNYINKSFAVCRNTLFRPYLLILQPGSY